MGLFDSETPKAVKSETISSKSPLAYRIRPNSIEDYFGQEEVFKRYPRLKDGHFQNLILWGPPGVGKTTLAQIIANKSGKELYRFNAVLGGVADLKKLISSAMEMKEKHAIESIIFIDEIHRFNKAQQDALLPYVEKGDFGLIGATTENPRSSINRALLSRVGIVELKALTQENIKSILERALEKLSIKVSEEVLDFISDHSSGDARRALNMLEIVEKEYALSGEEMAFDQLKAQILENARNYDRNQDRHYDVISAFIKSMRGSDPDAAITWLAVMLDGGEDPVFIARRLVIFASEDVGNADPSALPLAVAALSAVQSIGMPEARINLAQAVTYLAATVKSNAAYQAIGSAMSWVTEQSTVEVPDHLKNFPPQGSKKYLYPHSYEGHFVPQDYVKTKDKQVFYEPTEIGREKNIRERLKGLWPDRY
ncbi:MAG: replication-associated recombination protein A [Deltaproteobacteria bacterium]|nr:MAG: replication-associated recombination protein A [Deltaproteobacteria bacterium]TNF28774.1 MAG: replication-associated recombination protein A [Deltaproteobacteria bacterium]